MYIHGPCDLFAFCHALSAPVCQVFIAKMGWDAFGKADFETFQKAVAPWNSCWRLGGVATLTVEWFTQYASFTRADLR